MMADRVIGALMLIMSVTTSETPLSTLDHTHVVTWAFASMDLCEAVLKGVPLSDAEQEVEQTHKLRVLRACIKPNDQFWYTWGDGKAVSGRDAVVEAGPFRGR